MSDANVKIKLSADSEQVRRELKLIDKEIQGLGGSTPTGLGTGSKSKVTPISSKSKTTREERASGDIQKELSLIRKELQKLTKGKGESSTSPTPATPSSSGGSGGSGTGSSPSNSPSEKKDSNTKLLDALGKLASAAITLKAASHAYNYISAGASASMSGESKAYQTYGSTLAYSDYYVAKKDAKNLGSPYGYSYEEVMGASSSNMSLAGFTNIENHNRDMNAILGTSKAWGINSANLAGTSGFMSSIGVVESGNQRKFADMLSESIVQAGMTGREEEQLQVLETISENLARTLVKVDENALGNAMGLYTSLVGNNATLKGNRGASIVDSINNSIVNGDSTLDVLLGWGTKYTGVEGKVALQKLKEQGLTNPETLSQIFNNFEKYTGKSIDSAYGQMFLSNKLGLSYSQVEALLGSKDEIMSGKFDSSILEGDGSATKERLDNYGAADVSTQEKYGIEKQDTKETAGEKFNNFLQPFREWYSGLGDGGRLAVDAAGGAASLAAGGVAVKALKNGLGSLLGGGTGTSSGGSGLLSRFLPRTAAGAGSVADDVIANSVDDVAASTAGNVAKGIFGKLLGPLVQVGFGAYNYSKATNDTERASATGGTLAGVAGGLIGGMAGPLGSIALGWAGGELGKAYGEDVHNAKNNYGTGLAALPLIGGLFRKNGTLLEQERKKSENSLKSKFSAGKPSDYGLPKEFDKALSYSEYDGSVIADVRSGVLKNQYGYSQKELDKLFASKEFTNWMDAQGRVTHIDKSSYGKNADISTGISTDSPKMITISKDSGEYKDKYDASKDTLNQGYYKVWTGTQEELEEYKANRGSMLVGKDYWTRAETTGATEENPYMEKTTSKSVDTNTDALDRNTEAIKKLYEDKGLVYGAPYSSSYLKTKLSPTSGDTSDTSKSGGLFGSVISKIKSVFNFGSHAVGNDYIPYDNYLASLHKGEMVLTKMEADDYRRNSGKVSGVSNSLDLNINLNGSVDGMSQENQSKVIDAIIQQINNSGLQSMLSTSYTRVQNY